MTCPYLEGFLCNIIYQIQYHGDKICCLGLREHIWVYEVCCTPLLHSVPLFLLFLKVLCYHFLDYSKSSMMRRWLALPMEDLQFHDNSTQIRICDVTVSCRSEWQTFSCPTQRWDILYFEWLVTSNSQTKSFKNKNKFMFQNISL